MAKDHAKHQGKADGKPGASSAPGVSAEELRRPWQAYLARKQLNRSRARDAVVDVFLESSEHLSLEDLLARARARHPRVSLATVYRTMKLLEDAGLVEALHFTRGGPARYELTAGRAHHDHLVCKSCGTIVEFESDAIEELQQAIARRYGFTIVQHRHELYGLCTECQASAARASAGAARSGRKS